MEGFQEVIEACEFIKNEPNIINSIRFIFLWKFIASLKPIKANELSQKVSEILGATMRNHVNNLKKEVENKSVTQYSRVLS